MSDVYRLEATSWTDANGVTHDMGTNRDIITVCGINVYRASDYGMTGTFKFNCEAVTCLLCITSPP